MVDEDLEQQGADWVANMVSEEFETFIPSVFCDLVFATERRVREESGDPAMDHDTMAARLMEIFDADPEVPTDTGAVHAHLVYEVLHWEDQFRAMAGLPREVRPSPGRRLGL